MDRIDYILYNILALCAFHTIMLEILSFSGLFKFDTIMSYIVLILVSIIIKKG